MAYADGPVLAQKLNLTIGEFGKVRRDDVGL
jgi:hypothetical protein